MKKRILTVSSANIDLVSNVGTFPKAGQTVIERSGYTYLPGGKGANSAVAVARLGGDSVFCAALGNDSNGKALLALYNNEGIDTSFLSLLDDYPTGLAAVMVGDDGNNRIIVYPGANLHIPEKKITKALDSSPDALFMQLEIAPEAVVFAANEAAKRNIPVFIDAGPADRSFPLASLPMLEVFSPNESETEIFTGIKPTDEDSCEKAAKALSRLVRSHYYVIKLGGRGCYVTDLSCSVTVPTFPGKVVDTTAAGDSFTAALTLEFLRSGNIASAARYANAVGTLVVGKRGATPSIPTASEVNAFLKAFS